MTESEWLSCTDPQAMVGQITRPYWGGKRPADVTPFVSDRKVRLFLAICRRLSEPLNQDGNRTEQDAYGGSGPISDQTRISVGFMTAMYARKVGKERQCALLRDIFGNPFRPVALDPYWLPDDAIILARTMYDSRDFAAMPLLADLLKEAG